MSPDRPRPPRRDPKRDRVKFPFGETFDGNIEDLEGVGGRSGEASQPHQPEPSEDGPTFGSSGSRTPLPKNADLARRTMELRIEDIEGVREAPSEEGAAFDPFESHGDTPIVLRDDDDVRGGFEAPSRGPVPPSNQTLPPRYQVRRTGQGPPPGSNQTLPPGYEVRRTGQGPPPGSNQTLPPGYEVRRTGKGPPPGSNQTLPPGYEVRRTPGAPTPGSKQTLPPGYEVRRTGRPMPGPPPPAPSAPGFEDADGTIAPGYMADGTVAPGYTADRTASPDYGRAPLAGARPGAPPGPPMSGPPRALNDPFASERGAPPIRPPQPANRPPTRAVPRPGGPNRPPTRSIPRPPPRGPAPIDIPGGEVFEDRRPPRPARPPSRPAGPPPSSRPSGGLQRPPVGRLDDPFASRPRDPERAAPPRPQRPPGGWQSDLEASPLGEEAPELRREPMGPPKAAIDLFGSSDETPVPALYDSEDPDAVAGDSIDPDGKSWGDREMTIEDSIDGMMTPRLRGDSRFDDSMDSMDSMGDSIVPDSLDGESELIEDSAAERPAAPARPPDSAPSFRRPRKRKGKPKGEEAAAAAAKADSEGAVDRMVGLVTSDVLWILLSVGGALLGPLMIYMAWDYYGIPPHQRPGHAWDKLLRSGNGLGLWFGIGGSILFLLNLTYIARRRFGVFKKWVSLRLWLNMHFLFGLTGGSLILAHSALKFDNWVARVSSAAILIAIASGLFGRYVLIHLPRRQEGESFDRADLAAGLASLRRDLRQALAPYPPLRRVALEALEATELEEVEPKGILFVGQLILGDFKARRKTRDLEQKLRIELSRLSQDQDLEPLIDETLELVHMSSRLNRRLSQFEAVQDLMETWRAIHMILALIMVVTMVLHVTIVLTYSRISWF